MAPNDGDLKEILKKILMHTKHYFRCWILVGAAIGVFLFVTSPAGAQWVNYPTAGIPRTADGKPNLAGPVPRTADGKPDFSGVWQPDDQKFFQNLAAGLKPEDVPMQPWERTCSNCAWRAITSMILWRAACRTAFPESTPTVFSHSK